MLFICMLGTCARAQETLTGQLVGPDGEALPYAGVTVHRPGTSGILTFTTTDKTGSFRLTVDSLLRVELRARYLGLRTDTLLVDLPQTTPLRIQLHASNNELQSVTVKTKRAPITERNDTTVFNVGDFRDTTDRKIEEVLRKLPGVEVKEDGSIEINGKALHRILVEGSDLFGRRYQLGSKNLNARDIGRVEIINDYQHNTVLRSVNESTAVVLNLKLEERVESVIAGNVILGGGYGGGEAKYSEYATLYRIDRRHKTIFIGDADNVGNNFGFDEINATYGDPTGQDLSRPLTNRLPLNQIPDINQAGLKRPYTDNERRLFGTLRHESFLGQRWKVNAAITGLRGKRGQGVTELQRFVGDAERYELKNQRVWSVRNGGYVGDVKLSYLSRRGATSLDLFAGQNEQRVRLSDHYDQENKSIRLESIERPKSTVLRAQLNHQLRTGLVIQGEIASGRTRQPFSSSIRHPALDDLFPSTMDSILHQTYVIDQQNAYASAKLLWKTGALLTSWQLVAGRERLNLGGPENRYWSPAVNGRWGTGEHTEVLFGGNVRANRFRPFGELSALTHGWSLGLRRRDRGKILNLNIQSGRRYPGSDRWLTTFVYAPDPFQIVEGGPQPQRGTYLRVSGNYGVRNTEAFTHWSLGATLQRQANVANAATNFVGDLQRVSWIYGGNRESASLSARYSLFILPLKSEFTLRINTAFRKTDFRVQETFTTFRYWTNFARLEGGWLLFQHIRLKGSSSLRASKLLGKKAQFFTDWSNALQLILTYKKLRFMGGVSHMANFRADQNNSFSATFLGAEREVQWKDREVILRFQAYNLANRSAFVTQSVGDLFLYESRVPALGRYLLLTADISF